MHDCIYIFSFADNLFYELTEKFTSNKFDVLIDGKRRCFPAFLQMLTRIFFLKIAIICLLVF